MLTARSESTLLLGAMSKSAMNLPVFVVIGLGIVWSAGCARPSTAGEVRSAAIASCARSSRMSAKVAEKLSGSTQQAWTEWQLQRCWARTGETASLNSDEIEKRRVSVVVRFSGDPERLRAAGMSTGFSGDGRVSGIIAWSELETLAAVEGVQEIDLEPAMQTLTK